jgi:hypothetical protein
MHTVTVDIEKNRLYFTIAGHIELDELTKISDEVIAAATQLKPGFDSITQMNQFTPQNQEARMVMYITMKTAQSMGQKHIVRISSSPISRQQWRFSSITAGYQAFECGSLEEAENLLDELSEKSL